MNRESVRWAIQRKEWILHNGCLFMPKSQTTYWVYGDRWYKGHLTENHAYDFNWDGELSGARLAATHDIYTHNPTFLTAQ